MLYTHIGGYTHVGWLAHALRFERTCWNIGFFKRKGQAAANLREPSPPWRYKWIGENLCPLLIAKVIFYFFTTMFYPQFFMRHSWKRRTYRHFPLPSPIKTVPDKDREARDEKRNVQLPSLPASPDRLQKENSSPAPAERNAIEWTTITRSSKWKKGNHLCISFAATATSPSMRTYTG